MVSDQDKCGTIPPSDVITARTQLETAQSNLIALGVARAQNAHAIAVLVGKNPEDLVDPAQHRDAHLADGSGWRAVDAAAAPARHRDAPSARWPRRMRRSAWRWRRITRRFRSRRWTASRSRRWAGLLHVANYVWSLGGSATETLFDGGERSGGVDAAKAAYDAAVANYRGTVLTAFQDVENDLSGLRILAEQSDVLDAAVRDATRGAEIAFNEYQAGTVDYTTVATAQATQLTNQQTALNVQESRLLDAASLFGDLGGGWSDSDVA